MADLISQGDVIFEGVQKEAPQITRDAVQKVIEGMGSWLKMSDSEISEVITSSADAIKKILIENAGLAGQGVFPLMVLQNLKDKEVVKMEKLPEENEISIPQPVVDRLIALGILEKYVKTVAYIILNSSTKLEVDKKMAVSGFSADIRQLLMPPFRILCEKNPSIKDRIKIDLSDKQIVEMSPDEFEAFVASMLKILKEYLNG